MTTSSLYNPNAKNELSKLRTEAIKTFYIAAGAKAKLLDLDFQEVLLSIFESKEGLLMSATSDFAAFGCRENKINAELEAVNHFCSAVKHARNYIEGVQTREKNTTSLQQSNASTPSRLEIRASLANVKDSYLDTEETNALIQKYEHRLALDIIKETHPEYF